MKIIPKEPPRAFTVGADQKITLQDMAEVYLNPDEQVTFMTENKCEYDVARKSWGFYATPSMNDRLKRNCFKTALVKNKKGQLYIMLVEKEKRDSFEAYLHQENNHVLQWLDEEPLLP